MERQKNKMKRLLTFLISCPSLVWAGFSFMPEAATETAAKVDTLYAFLLIVSAISCVLVIGGFIFFALKYRRKTENDKTAYITHNHFLEFLWSFIPLVFFLIIFVWGWWVYHDMRTFPKDSLEIHVTGQKWFWEFQYKSGRKTTNELYVPAGRAVKLIYDFKRCYS